MENPTVVTIVLSYNRPKMLREALESVSAADEVIIVDDGSDFDVVSVAKEFHLKKLSLIGAPQITIEERLKIQRLPSLINEAIKSSSCDIVTYLCDDDIMGPNWIHDIKYFYNKYGDKYHLLRGELMGFVGDKPEKWGIRDYMDFLNIDSRQLICGDFCHLRKCSIEENMFWPSGAVWGHDSMFIYNIDATGHDTWLIPFIPTVAVYRRTHDKNLGKYLEVNVDENGYPILNSFSKEAISMLKKNKFLE